MKEQSVLWFSFKHRNPPSAFTIVELLVAVAIILMMTALLMPALSHVRETSKSIKCMSNLRQISMVTHLYAADNNGLIPWSEKGATELMFTRWSRDPQDGKLYNANYPQNKWFADYFGAQTAYGKMNEVAYCPAGGRLGAKGANVSSAYNKTVGSFANISYGVNPELVVDHWFIDNKHADRNAVPLSQITQPGKVCLWADAQKVLIYPWAQTLDGRHFSRSKSINNDTPTVGGFDVNRCHGRVNVAYVDQRIGFVTVSGPADDYEVSPDPGTQFWDHTHTDKPYPEWQAQKEGWSSLPPCD